MMHRQELVRATVSQPPLGSQFVARQAAQAVHLSAFLAQLILSIDQEVHHEAHRIPTRHPGNAARADPARRQLGGSDRPVNPLSGPDGAQRVYLPVIGNNTSFLSPIIPETTNALHAGDDATTDLRVA